MKPHLLLAPLLFFLTVLVSSTASASNDADDWSMGPLGGTFRTQPGTRFLQVRSVPAGTPAATAGLKVGDLIGGAFGQDFGVLSTSRLEGYRGSVQDFGEAIERAESGDGVLPLRVFRSGMGVVGIDVHLPAVGGFGPAYPLGSPKFDALYETACADMHNRIMASGYSPGYNGGRFGLCLLAHPDWNSTSGPRPYRNSINKLRDLCISYLASRALEPVEPDQPGYVDPGLENWNVTSCALYLGEYRRKTGDTSVDAAVQRAAEMLANRIQHYAQRDDRGTLRNKIGIMGHGGVVGDYPHLSLTGINIINAHTLVAMASLKGAGADFSALSGSSGLTIDRKFRLNWDWMKSCMDTSGGTDDGNVGYAWAQNGYDSSARTAGAIAGWHIYQAAGGEGPTGNDLDRLGRMKSYALRHWQRMQHAHAYTAGGVVNYQLMLPFLAPREQRYLMENLRFFYQFHRTSGSGIAYFGGRENNGGDSDGGYLGYANVKLYNVAIARAVVSGGLPSMPPPDTSVIHAHLRSPWTSWPTPEARRGRLEGLTHTLDCVVTDWQGTPLAAGVTASWTKVSGPGTVVFSSPSTAATDVTFSSTGTYRLRLTAAHGTSSTEELYDFEVTQPSALPGYARGQVPYEIFNGITGTAVSNLTGSPKFAAGIPDRIGHLSSLDTTYAGDNYGQRIRGVIIPPASGSYRFYIASDDASEFRFNAAGPDPSGVIRICQVTGYSSKYNWTASSAQQSALVALTAGQPYAFEILHKEGSGADHCAVAWTGPGIPTPTVIGGDAIAMPDEIRVISHPQDRLVAPGGSASLTFLVSAPGPILYEWKLDGTSHWGVSSEPTLNLQNISPGAAGTYTCVVTTPAGSFTSQPAVLSLPGALVRRGGGLRREVFTGVSGSTVAALTSLARYPRFPDLTTTTSSAEAPRDYADSYGQRLSGWLVPPTTGQYRFTLSSDDASQLWLSTDESPDHRVLRCQVSGYTNYRTYGTGSARSNFITLQAGKRYYIEILHKDGGGADHLTLAWQTPGGSAPANGSPGIPGEFLEYLHFVPGPTDHWKLDESTGTVANNSVRALHGSHSAGTMTGQPGAAPGTGASVYYDGSTYTEIPAPNLNTNTVTFTAWIRREGTQAVWAPILFTRAGSSTAGFGFGDTPELRYHWNDTGYTFASGITVPDGQWCLAAMSVSPTGVTLHLRTPSGLQSATHTATIAAEEFDGPLQIGRDPGHASRRFKGWIDDVRIHSTALLAAEIEALYQEAASAPAVTLAVPENGSWTLATHVVLEASIPPGPAPLRRVDFLEGDTVIASATAEPWKVTVPSMPLGDHTLRARVAYGEWDYEAFSPPVSFTVLAEEPIPTMTLAVEASPAEGGTTSGSGDHPRGSSVPITAIPTEGWMFTGWSGEGITDPSSPETTVTLDSARTVIAHFAPADPYPAWAESMGLTGEDSDPDADPDGDGVSNRAEMLLGLHPADPNSRLELSIVSVGTDTLRLRINRAVTTGTFVLRSSSDLSGNWTETPVAIPADTVGFEFEIPRSGGRSFHQLVYRTP